MALISDMHAGGASQVKTLEAVEHKMTEDNILEAEKLLEAWKDVVKAITFSNILSPSHLASLTHTPVDGQVTSGHFDKLTQVLLRAPQDVIMLVSYGLGITFEGGGTHLAPTYCELRKILNETWTEPQSVVGPARTAPPFWTHSRVHCSFEAMVICRGCVCI